jgi:hypothetical protein
MTELSKIASESWKRLSDEENIEWKRLYEINRDLPQNTPETPNEHNASNQQDVPTDKKDLVEVEVIDNDPPIKVEVVETVDQLSDKRYYEINMSNSSNTTGTNLVETAVTDNDPPIKIEVVETVDQSLDKKYYEVNAPITPNTIYKKDFVETAATDNAPLIKMEVNYS